ncbi:hypothetical protein TRIUR3_25250 [Triticum urartu]|uniref:Uncharacterized protein n=1 Tax=Triticum urartu TaxID=4572 RepID=M7YZB4_TRIUA|nr:hypothetical protein TRIUR3_25250 [Triticum urartu]
MAREMLAMLGAIPPLVAMLDQGGGGDELLAAALYALLNMGIGNDTNKAAIVQAGAVHKMLRIAEAASGALTGALVANFLCLSALDANKPIIGASGAAPFPAPACAAAVTGAEERRLRCVTVGNGGVASVGDRPGISSLGACGRSDGMAMLVYALP